MAIYEKIVTYFEQRVKVNCDGNCKKAWGTTNRPLILLDPKDEDDWCWYADDELDDAPDNPGTYEGNDGKPSSALFFPNKWCVRECERCNMSRYGVNIDAPLPVLKFDKRVYNIPSKHPEAK